MYKGILNFSNPRIVHTRSKLFSFFEMKYNPIDMNSNTYPLDYQIELLTHLI